MQYKTIVLELLRQVPETHERLKASRTLLATTDHLTDELKTSHEAWKARLSRANPETGDRQISSAALELAINDLEASLYPASSQDGNDPPTSDAATADPNPPSPPA